ncbi:MAG: LemA family protein [Firmicutes bacterium]|nr:LemA family protein [Bacillota bacterium]
MLTVLDFLTSPMGAASAAAAALLFIFLAYCIAAGNTLARLMVKVQEAASGIDVALSKRYGVLKKVFEASKGYMAHEKYIVLESIKLRGGMPMEEKNRAAARMDTAAVEISAVGEAYPQLASSEIFIQLQKSISDTEEHLQAARRLYNANVSVLNQKIVSFPASVAAAMRGVKKQQMFVAQEAHRADIDMTL